MSDIDPYIKIMFFTDVSDLQISALRYRIDEISVKLLDQLEKVVVKRGAENVTDDAALAAELFDELAENNVFIQETERFAGTYYVYSSNNYKSYRDKVLRASEIYAASQRIGSRFFPDVLEGFRNFRYEENGEGLPSVAFAPASNRLVSLQHNQVRDLDAHASKIIEAVSSQNQIDERPGFRELIIGQLKAGRELIRAGEFRLYLLQISLIETLNWLVRKYAKDLIGDLAVRLLEALTKGIEARRREYDEDQ